MSHELIRAKAVVAMAMRDSDVWCVSMRYRNSEGVLTQRMVSPIRFLDDAGDRFLALCLCREEPRHFVTERCSALELVHSSDVLMPVPIVEIQEEQHAGAANS